MKITVETFVKSEIESVWQAWNTPEDIMQWNAASEDWHTTSSSADLREGGKFTSRMEAKDGSMGFDFEGVYTKVVEHRLLEYTLGDERLVRVEFIEEDGGVKVIETFEAETTNSPEMQREGWQAILDNFARYVEAQQG
jgi:uncharacterized protein YndB with AHSA1/START domain